MANKDVLIPVKTDFSIHEKIDDLERKLEIYKNREDVFQFVYDDLMQDILEIRRLLYIHRVCCAIPVFRTFDILAERYYCDDCYSSYDNCVIE